ncbi:DUF6892 domain-containing protein [Streptomyces nitrosporeus]|uniref:DUF6892 domain-containing protein n=1 Tax=Streptomyces nitrosporeus TaxID=28894 RepID=UPI00399F37DC
MTTFQDFAFKLLVVEELMYRAGTLTPVFDLRAHMRGLGVKDLDTYVERNGLQYTVLDEARAYFEALEIPAELLAGVEHLVFDGGNRVFMECAPVWDGEDDLFHVRRLDDVELLPNLRLFTGGRALEHMVPGASEILAARGVVTR